MSLSSRLRLAAVVLVATALFPAVNYVNAMHRGMPVVQHRQRRPRIKYFLPDALMNLVVGIFSVLLSIVCCWCLRLVVKDTAKLAKDGDDAEWASTKDVYRPVSLARVRRMLLF